MSGVEGQAALRALLQAVVPARTCSFSCIHCPHGRSSRRTLERTLWDSPGALAAEVERRLGSPAAGREVCEVALAGGGEPTLHAGLGEIIERLHRLGLPVAVHTNGSLLWSPEVQRDLAAADRVVLTLCAGEERLFQYVNRPCPGLSFEQLLCGARSFRAAYSGPLEVEALVLGVTAVDADVRALAQAAEPLRPSRVLLRTSTGTTAEAYAFAAQEEILGRFAGFFRPRARPAPQPRSSRR